ncbi:MAG: hypothetical protein ISQ06_06060 [Planctomycetaceae bacterium]|nr:hypothetical protein [Planctomycetaceae bacterium]
MSNDSTETVSNEPGEKPPRNPVERVLVWGMIAALLVVVGIEARAQRGYTMSLNAFQTAFADAEEVQISLDEARRLMVFGPTEVKSPKEFGPLHYYDYYRFSWPSLFKSGEYEITLKVTDNDELAVISFSTPAAPQPDWMGEVIQLPGEFSPENPGAMGGGFPGGGGGQSGGRGFRPPPNPLITKLDTDGDDELSAEEIEGSPAVLQSLDANGDGDLTQEEFDPEGLGRRGGGPEQGGFVPSGNGNSDSVSSRPQRPPLEE